MKNKRCAVLLDVTSIQEYIFQSNKLRENLGASFLIEEMVYGKYLKEAAEKVLEKAFEINAWKTKTDRIQPDDVGYIGGGNALLLFLETEKADAFIQEWTKNLLIRTPGITSAVAVSDDFDLDDFRESKKTLFNIMQENKARHIPQTIIPMHGITSECTHSGLSMDVWNSSAGEDRKGAYVSAGTNAKIEASERSQERIHEKYKNLLRNEFCFTNELEKLGGISGEDSHIAIVHIDGNSMGERFKKTDSLEKIRNLSTTVENATQEAFSELLGHITENFERIMDSLGFDNHSKDERYWYPKCEDDQKKILPIRPIILGGDDLTFVCDGKLGLYFSKRFIKAFEQKDVSDGEKLTACAGVAITKTKYPFYRGYRLAEKLCENAKKVRKEKKDSHSYIDFHISTGGLAGTLQEIREKYFSNAAGGNLMYRPYKLISEDSKDEQSFDLFVRNTRMLRKFPRNKIYELRQVLSLSKESAKQFVQEMRYRGRQLPEIPGRGYHDSLFENGVTPYFDMIELMELYPDFMWKESEAKNEAVSA